MNRLPNDAHTSRPWRIHELTGGFRLEDVWPLPGDGGPDDLARNVELLSSLDVSAISSPVVRALFAIRLRIGELLGWDRPEAGVDARVPTLRDRLPPDLRSSPSGPDAAGLPFRSLYLLDDEWAAETANRTVHGVVHIGRCPDAPAGARMQLAIYVKPNGLLGEAYMAAIKPFRYLLVYPALLRQFDRIWRDGARSSPAVAP